MQNKETSGTIALERTDTGTILVLKDLKEGTLNVTSC